MLPSTHMQMSLTTSLCPAKSARTWWRRRLGGAALARSIGPAPRANLGAQSRWRRASLPECASRTLSPSRFFDTSWFRWRALRKMLRSCSRRRRACSIFSRCARSGALFSTVRDALCSAPWQPRWLLCVRVLQLHKVPNVQELIECDFPAPGSCDYRGRLLKVSLLKACWSKVQSPLVHRRLPLLAGTAHRLEHHNMLCVRVLGCTATARAPRLKFPFNRDIWWARFCTWASRTWAPSCAVTAMKATSSSLRERQEVCLLALRHRSPWTVRCPW